MLKPIKQLILLAHSRTGLLLVTGLLVCNCIDIAVRLKWLTPLVVLGLFVIACQCGAVFGRSVWCATVVFAVHYLPLSVAGAFFVKDMGDAFKGLRPYPMIDSFDLAAIARLQLAGSAALIMAVMGLWSLRLGGFRLGLPDPITGEEGIQNRDNLWHTPGRLKLPLQRIADLCGHHRIHRLTMLVYEEFEFGDAWDLLVEFNKGTPPGLAFFAVEQAFAELLDRRVSLMTPVMDQACHAGRRLSIKRTLCPIGYRPRRIKPPRPLLSPTGKPITFEWPSRLPEWTDKPLEPAARPDLPLEPVADFCRSHRIRRLLLIDPSWRRSSPADDVDLVAEFDPGHTPGLVFFGLEQELSAVADRRVDLRTPAFLSPRVRDRMLATARVLYEAA